MLAEAVRRNVLLSKTSDVDIANSAKDWFKYAADREGGRREREKRKENRSMNQGQPPNQEDDDSA